MLIPPLARACRPGIRPPPVAFSLRVFTSGPLHRKDAHGHRAVHPHPHTHHRPPPPLKDAAHQAKAAPSAKPDPLLLEKTVSSKEQRKVDLAIMKEMSRYLWPKDSLGTRFRVGLSVALLVGAKLLNVQIPFYFKSIVDAMNIDFLAVGGTAWTVAGSMIVACKRCEPGPCPSD